MQDVKEAYAYLLGRAIVIRQEQTDLQEAGIDYNVIKYNPAGQADFVNPNLDVAYLEAWIAVDQDTPAILEVPEVKGRYYTAQILDEWGEVITNINERNYPTHPFGRYAFVAPGSRAEIPAGAVRIELHSNKAKMLARVELRDDRDGAVALQKQFRLQSLGKPAIRPIAPMAPFGNKDLLGVEIFDDVEAVLASAQDVSPSAAALQAQVRDAGMLAKDPASRAELDAHIRAEIVPQFLNYAVTQSGVFKNNWLATLGTGNYGGNYRIRAAANLVGLWANTNDEVIYFVGTRDADGDPLDGGNDYVIHFPADSLPGAVVDAYWSVILVSVPDYRVVPNPLNRFNLNSYSPMEYGSDGSLKIVTGPGPVRGVLPSNWLPSAPGQPFSLTFRTYVPRTVVKSGNWSPPAPVRLR